MTSLTWKSYQLPLLVFTILTLISGCKSTPEPDSKAQITKIPAVLSHYPADVKITGDDIVDIQLALGDRNLYLNQNGNIKMQSTRQCPIDIAAHRGDYRQPESSNLAIAAALNDNYNSVEIDVMLLKDGTWVNHHDKYTGRATVHYTGQRYKVEKMKLNQFAQLKLRNKQSHDLLDIRPITAYEAFQTFVAYRSPGQKLNVEIKSDTYGQKLVELDNMLRQLVGQGHFYYSSADLDTLEKLRGINPTTYLGFVQGAHPTSVELLQRDLRRGVKNDAYYLDNQNKLEFVGKYGTKRYRSRYKNYASSKGVTNLVRKLGRNSGLHLDIRSYMQHKKVKRYAEDFGMKTYTYSINGSEYHQSQLLRLSRASLPHGAIVDATPFKICQQLFSPAKPKGNYHALSAVGRYIEALPADADFDQFQQMLGYQHEGYYISLNSGLKAINARQTTVVETPKAKTTATPMFPTIVDETIETRSTNTIILTLPSNKDER
ncbi:glycerophosphodiester phosphodiesterase family protein [uncultured Shewanella sp.]|uniref:glycerophosphodiester phosphodiesterase n=1 Tax=Shewanella atlantica TaxID=271099 RepID=UPI0026108596|nr:glycerophosphodiester phosphodiesterase family protein [uncultured Shewanella sp.]